MVDRLVQYDEIGTTKVAATMWKEGLLDLAKKNSPDEESDRVMLRTSIMSVLNVFFFMHVSAHGAIVPVTFVELPDMAGGSPALTVVYRADLSGVGLTEIQSIAIRDNSSGIGGAGGEFSGFDLDAIVLSSNFIASGADADTLTSLPVFDFSTAGTFFTAGTQRPPIDPKLFGTDVGGTNVDNAVATLGAFDADSDVDFPDGFVSMGDNGVLGFNLTAPVSPAGLYLYIGEVGGQGEVAAGAIEVSDRPVPGVPEPHALLVWSLLAMAAMLKRQRRS